MPRRDALDVDGEGREMQNQASLNRAELRDNTAGGRGGPGGYGKEMPSRAVRQPSDQTRRHVSRLDLSTTQSKTRFDEPGRLVTAYLMRIEEPLTPLCR
jgi:hypothetical protein